MRSSSILFLILSISLLSCRKEHQPIPLPQQAEPEDKVVHWELRSLETIGAAYYDGFIDSFTAVSDSSLIGYLEFINDSLYEIDYTATVDVKFFQINDSEQYYYYLTSSGNYIKTDHSYELYTPSNYKKEYDIIYENESNLILRTKYYNLISANADFAYEEKGIMYLTFGK